MVGKLVSVEGIFNQVSHIYDWPMIQSAFYARIQDALIQTLLEENPKQVLDAGCGTGELLLKLEAMFPKARLHGLDLSESMIKKASSKNFKKSPELYTASVYDIPMKAKSVDLITNTISSHFYIELPDALNEFYRVLKPGGKLLMANVTNGIVGHLPGPFGEQVIAPAQRYRSRRTWLDFYELTGFRVVETRKLIYPVELFICEK